MHSPDICRLIALPLFLVAAATAEDDGDYHEWESGLHAPVKWEALSVVAATSKLGRLEAISDGSLRAPGDVAAREMYAVTATTALRGITAFRVEVLPEKGSVGRDANVALREFKVKTEGAMKPLRFVIADSGSAHRDSGPELAIDGDMRTGWRFVDVTTPHAAVFQLEKPVDGGPSAMFVITLAQESALNRIRITATVHAPPVLELPESIRQAIALEPSERSDKQREELRAFYNLVRAAKPSAKSTK